MAKKELGLLGLNRGAGLLKENFSSDAVLHPDAPFRADGLEFNGKQWWTLRTIIRHWLFKRRRNMFRHWLAIRRAQYLVAMGAINRMKNRKLSMGWERWQVAFSISSLLH